MGITYTKREKIVDDLVASLSRIHQHNGYRTDVNSVEREFRQLESNQELPIIFVNYSRDTRESLLADVLLVDGQLTIVGVLSQGTRDTTKPGQETAQALDRMIADIEEAQLRDITRGGNALSTRITNINTDIGILQPWASVIFTTMVRFFDKKPVPIYTFPEVRYFEITQTRKIQVMDKLRSYIKGTPEDLQLNVSIYHEMPKPDELYSQWLPMVLIVNTIGGTESYDYTPGQHAWKKMRLPLLGFVYEEKKEQFVKSIDDLISTVKTRIASFCDLSGLIQQLDIISITDQGSNYPVGRFKMDLDLKYYDSFLTA